MPKNKEMFPWILHSLYTALMPPRVYKPQYLLMKDPINIPYNSTENLEDPRLDYYSPRTSVTKDISELDAMLCTQLENDGIITETTTDNPIDDATLQAPKRGNPQPQNG